VQEDDVIREFLIESSENLNRLDQEIVELEQRPHDKELLASVFRTIHTIKGTCGFLGFPTLEKIAHQAESLLSQLRAGERPLSAQLVALILECLDAVRKILGTIEATGKEGRDDYLQLLHQLESAARMPSAGTVAPEEAPAADSLPAEHEKTSAAAESAIRVDVGLLDKLMNLVGELVLARNQVLQFTTQQEDAALNATSQRLNLITSELQENVMKTRMQPIGVVWNKLPRLVRDTAQACGKQVRLEMDGADTGLDKTIIEAIKDPLTHMVRNCCDHGIETAEERIQAGKPPHGTVTLRAYHEGGQVIIEIADDGSGVDLPRVKQKAVEKGLVRPEQVEQLSEQEALDLIFQGGVSTARTITKVSGRGVGLDVVRSNVERIGGVVDVASTAGQGTVFRLKIPLTLAIIPGLVVTSGGERFLIPQASLLELIRIEGDSAGKIERVHGTPVYRRRGSLLPVVFLSQVLGLEGKSEDDATNIVVLQAEEHQFGLVVDSIKDTQEIVVKPLGKQLKGLQVYAGATIMGDGDVALILDVLSVGQRSGALQNRQAQGRADSQVVTAQIADHQRMLLFQAGSFARLAVPLSLVARLEEFPQSMLEQAGGRHVVQYRGGILTVVSLSSVLEPDSPNTAVTRDPVVVIVFTDGARSLGIMVDQILDIVEEAVAARQASKRHGLLGSAVVGGHVTDFLDVRTIIESAAAEWLDPDHAGKGASVLVAEPSSFLRGLLRGELEMAGHRVTEAATQDEAMDRLEHREIRVVLADMDLPPLGCGSLRETMRKQPNLARIPMVALASSAEQIRERPEGLEDCQVKLDRKAMLASIDRLAQAVNGAASEVAAAIEESQS